MHLDVTHDLLLGGLIFAATLCGFMAGIAIAVHPLTRQPYGLSNESYARTAGGALTLMVVAAAVAGAFAYAFTVVR